MNKIKSIKFSRKFKIFIMGVAAMLAVSQIIVPYYNYLKSSEEDRAVSKWSKKVSRHFFDEKTFSTYGSFFKVDKCQFTARHVITEAAYNIPPFADDESKWEHGLKGMDISLYNRKGCSAEDFNVPNEGDSIIAIGYPQRSRNSEVLFGEVYIERGEGSNEWIASISYPDEPVSVGMSGGLVLSKLEGEKYKPVGVIIKRNSPADLDGDNDPEHSFDFTGIIEAIQ